LQLLELLSHRALLLVTISFCDSSSAITDSHLFAAHLPVRRVRAEHSSLYEAASFASKRPTASL
jgi:hypothetical protein